jgi:hypothetical protein
MFLQQGVIIEALPGYLDGQKLINIDDVVRIMGPGAVLRLRKAEYTTGEYRHCIEILGATNVKLSGISCNDSGGDGLYIGAGKQGPSRNIKAEDALFVNNRRQGMSITSATGVHIQRCHFVATKGTPGETGIDIEPNGSDSYVQDIHIEDSATDGNNGNGISFELGNLTAASPRVDITVLRHHSGCNGGSGFVASYETNGNIAGVPGCILVDGGTSEHNGSYGAVASFYNSSGPKLTFRNLVVVDVNQTRTTYDNAAIGIKRGGGGIGLIGNVYFLNPTIIDTKGKLDYYYTLRDFSYVGFAHVQVSLPAAASGAAHAHPYGLLQGQGVDAVSIP